MDIIEQAKRSAKILRKSLNAKAVELSHGACLEIVAHQMGYESWNELSARSADEERLSIHLFVEHGRVDEASAFYSSAFGAVEVSRHDHQGNTRAVYLALRKTRICVVGSNPKREQNPAIGGPFSPKDKGTVSSVVALDVSDLDKVVQRAVNAGATLRFGPDTDSTGGLAASLFDPFGHIWALAQATSGGRTKPRLSVPRGSLTATA
ncbi:glyoxalase superfamily protein [Nisaea acidiphila]|uniref:Glyoxalase superfamily protein n=1 Tax=Nisaea acidiphila TaxID=1862145 RepID=A0A9J7AUX1_9PROT|nr:glyoxalase superfamily protein [Nisaea acidiphila]UUX51128.1 glyoxalase superfamily protein [Nisaea acidiphila]